MHTFIVGTRASQLAIKQTRQIVDQLHMLDGNHCFKLKLLSTLGDRDTEKPLHAFKEQGIFTNDVEEALLSHAIDLAVHSLKDIDIHRHPDERLTIAAIAGREDARDVFISRDGLKLADLPDGAIIGTSSLRRQAQLKKVYPNLTPKTIRGPVDERINQLFAGHFDGVILAAAGIHRLEKHAYITEYLPIESFTPAAGQGAIAIQCRKEDHEVLDLLAKLHKDSVALATDVERSFLAQIDAENKGPLGVYAYVEAGMIHLTVHIVSVDGGDHIHYEAVGKSKEAVVEEALEAVLERGAKELLHDTLSAGV